MGWLANFFRRGHVRAADCDADIGNLVEQNADKFERATEAYFNLGCDLKTAYPALAELGLDQIEYLRLTALIPIICGREIFADKPIRYAPHYVVTNFGRKRVEIRYDSCVVCEGIRRVIRRRSPAEVGLPGALACETQSINDILLYIDQQKLPLDWSKVVLQPTELKC